MYVDLKAIPGVDDVVRRVLRVNVWCEVCGEPSKTTVLKDPARSATDFWNHRAVCRRCERAALEAAGK